MAAEPVSPLVAPTTVRWYLSGRWVSETRLLVRNQGGVAKTHLCQSCPHFS